MRYAFPPPPVSSIPIHGSDELFPVRRIYCVGRNYAEHTREMGHDPDREPPFFFQKTPDSLVIDGRFPYPSASRDVHHEIELVVALSSGGVDIPVNEACSLVFGYAVGLDMTRRDLQAEAKKSGRPWESGKAFEHSAPITPLRRSSEIGHPTAGAISLQVNGTVVQQGDLSQMIWSVSEAISELSRLWRLAPGDLIMTGTPAGVGPVRKGDELIGSIAGVGELHVSVI